MQWTTETKDIIAKHCKDFNSATYSTKIKAAGGYAAYVDSLGGIFKAYRKNAEAGKKVTTAADFRKCCEYVQGLMAVWGFDYSNGNSSKSTYWHWGSSTTKPAADAFYQSGKGKCNTGTISDLCQGTGGRGRTTNCNYGADTLLKAAGLYKRGTDAFTTWATKYGKPVTSKKNLQTGDIVHFFSKKIDKAKPSTWKSGNWHHVAIVHTVDKDNGKIWLADFGSRFIKSKNPLHYMPLNTSAQAGGEYKSYYWTAIHHTTLTEEAPRMNGIDIASYQAGIDLTKVPGDFVIIKTTQGTYYKNPAAPAQIESAKKAGKLLGLYHYAAGTNPEAEADYFLASVGSNIKKAVLALDWERNENPVFGTGSSVSWVYKFMHRIHDKSGVWPLFYCQQSEVLARDWAQVSADCGLWLAQYAVASSAGYNPYLQYGALRAWGAPAIWQYTSGGTLSGYGARLDLNVAYMNKSAWARYADPAGSTTIKKDEEEIPVPKTVKQGSTGKAVKVMQAALGGLTIDGKAGPKTIAAVKAFQAKKGLTQDGVCGPKTWRALLATLG